MRRTLAASITANVILIAVGIFFTWKRVHFRHDQVKDRLQHTYLDNPQYAEQVSVQGAYIKQADIVFFGDSHIYKARWDELLDRNDIAVRGIGSDVTAGYLHRLDQVMMAHPKVVFIEGGANDMYYHLPVDSIITNLKTLVDFFKANKVIPVLHQLPPYARTEPTADAYNSELGYLNYHIELLAREEGIACIDLYSLLVKDGYLDPAYSQADGVHLTGAAYAKWADEINRILLKIQRPYSFSISSSKKSSSSALR